MNLRQMAVRGVVVLQAAGLAGVEIHAQDIAPELASVVRKNLAPISGDFLDVRFPHAVRSELDNGLTVIIIEDRRFGLVSLRLDIAGSGAIFDPPGMEGLAGITAGMLRGGTTTRTDLEIRNDMARLGASFSSGTGFEAQATTITASGLSRRLEDWFPILGDIIVNPAFSESSLVQMRLQGEPGISRQQASASSLAEQRYHDALYGEHPAARRTATTSSLDAVSVEAVFEWHRERYVPQNSILTIVGDVDPDALVPWLGTELAEWKSNDFVYEPPSAPVRPARVDISLIDRPGSLQVMLLIGNLAVERNHPDYVGLRVANELLGGGPASRLFGVHLQDPPAPYTAYSTLWALNYAGPWTVSAAFRAEDAATALERILGEIDRLKDEPIAAAELDRVKRSVAGSFALSLEAPEALANYALLAETHGLPDGYWDAYATGVVEVTAEDVARIVGEYLNPDTLRIVAVGDGAEILSALERYGPVEVYNVDGNLLN